MRVLDFFKVAPQYLLPQHTLSKLMYGLMHIEQPWIKNNIIKLMVKLYDINVSEAKEEDFDHYPNFNAFFTRALKPELRPVDPSNKRWCSPVDGVVSQSQTIQDNRLIQAKCHDYSLEALLGGDIEYAQRFRNGDSAVIYLSPKDYHRIHMPCEGRLLSMTYVPGNLFAVNPATVRQVDQLFARNERLVIRFKNKQGIFCLIMVGAIFVGSMETVWEGQITPEYQPTLQHWDYQEQQMYYAKGAEIGRFNMGSTVILLSPPEVISELGRIENGRSVKMGENLATYDSENHPITPPLEPTAD